MVGKQNKEDEMFGMTATDLSTRIRTSRAGAVLQFALDRRSTPGIEYLWGERLLALDESWYDQIESITREEPHLLTKTRTELEPAARDGRVVIAIDTQASNRVVGCIILWELERDQSGQMWCELGTYVVARAYRFKSGTHRSMPIGDILYRMFLDRYRNSNILGTTTNIKAIHIGQRHGMQMISFDQLPPEICKATCICPPDKTGTQDNWQCCQRNEKCRVRVPFATWRRMGSPTRLAYP